MSLIEFCVYDLLVGRSNEEEETSDSFTRKADSIQTAQKPQASMLTPPLLAQYLTPKASESVPKESGQVQSREKTLQAGAVLWLTLDPEVDSEKLHFTQQVQKGPRGCREKRGRSERSLQPHRDSGSSYSRTELSGSGPA